MKPYTQVALLAVVLLCAPVLADDIFPPEWRTDPPGQGFTTFQMWEFGTNANPAVPDVVFNSFGDPLATIEYDSPFEPWVDEDHGHQGVWYIEDWMELGLPNNPEPNDYKEVWLQITYYAEGQGEPQFFSDPEFSSVTLVNQVALDDWYTHATYSIIFEPNPEFETIYIVPRDCTIYVDEIVVDTICVPEPGTMLLLLLPVAALRRR